MFGIEAVREELSGIVNRLDAAMLEARAAQCLVVEFAAIENLAAAAKALCAKRVADSGSWKVAGDRSAAHWFARTTGTTVTAAHDSLATVERLADLPAVDEALRAGQLTAVQAREVASAAAVVPGAEGELLEAAATDSLVGLREQCRAVRAAAMSAADDAARLRALHASRYLRRWTDGDGAVCGRWRLAPDRGARVLAALDAQLDQVFAQARTAGRRESSEAYAADALVALVTGDPAETGDPGDPGDGSGARGSKVTIHAKVIARIDHPALYRGYTIAGETCEIAGVGPVPVEAVREMMGDAFLAAVVTKGIDVVNVAHLGRRATAAQRTALEWRDPQCVVKGCHRTARLETDHRTGWAQTHTTHVNDLDRLCEHHHRLKTRYGWRLEPGTGTRAMHPPEPRPRGPDP